MKLPSAHGSGLVATVDVETGWVTGWVFTADPDNDRVSYAGTGPTRKGSVIVYEDASFLYKPTVEARRVAAALGGDQDTFTITVRGGRGCDQLIAVTVDVLPTV
jgi:VCBS repeat-containing protein